MLVYKWLCIPMEDWRWIVLKILAGRRVGMLECILFFIKGDEAFSNSYNDVLINLFREIVLNN